MASGASTAYPSTRSTAGAVIPPRASSAYPVAMEIAVAVQMIGERKPPAARHADARFIYWFSVECAPLVAADQLCRVRTRRGVPRFIGHRDEPRAVDHRGFRHDLSGRSEVHRDRIRERCLLAAARRRPHTPANERGD